MALGSFPLIYKEIFDNAIPSGKMRYLAGLFALMGVVFIFMMVMHLVWGFWLSKLTSVLLTDIRSQMLQRLQNLSVDYFSRINTGDTMSRFTNDVNAVENYFLVALPSFTVGTLLFIFSAILLFLVEWHLALITIAALPLTALANLFLGEKTNQASYIRRKSEADITTHLEEIVTSSL